MFAVSQSISAFLGRKTIETEVYIPAAIDVVWDVLTDLNNYAHWNPIFQLKHVLNEQPVAQGTHLIYSVLNSRGKRSTVKLKVRRLENQSLINQVGGVKGLRTFNHSYCLTRRGPGTLLVIMEEYTGILVNFWNVAPKVAQHKRVAEALKQRIGECYLHGV